MNMNALSEKPTSRALEMTKEIIQRLEVMEQALEPILRSPRPTEAEELSDTSQLIKDLSVIIDKIDDLQSRIDI